MNGIKVKCCNVEGPWEEGQTEVRILKGFMGKWRDWRMCEPGTFAMGFDAKLESRKATDDTGMTGVRMICDTLGEEEGKLQTYEDDTKWGTWVHNKRDDLDSVTKKTLYCGGKGRLESDQGWFGDNTAMNGIKMAICD